MEYGPNKDPGHKSFSAAFLSKILDNCDKKAHGLAAFFIVNENSSVGSVNNTLISLILKIPHLEVLSHFC